MQALQKDFARLEADNRALREGEAEYEAS